MALFHIDLGYLIDRNDVTPDYVAPTEISTACYGNAQINT